MCFAGGHGTSGQVGGHGTSGHVGLVMARHAPGNAHGQGDGC